MSKDSRDKKLNDLLAETVVSIDAVTSDVSPDDKRLRLLHKELDESIDSLHAKQQYCCPILMKKLKVYRLFIKRLLENKKESSSALA